MKFNSEFDRYQNGQAWKEHCLNMPRTDYHSLNSDEMTFLRSINDQLRQLARDSIHWQISFSAS